jgi:hypothetical protein
LRFGLSPTQSETRFGAPEAEAVELSMRRFAERVTPQVSAL